MIIHMRLGPLTFFSGRRGRVPGLAGGYDKVSSVWQKEVGCQSSVLL